MQKRLLAALCAALFLIGVPASADHNTYETPALVTGVLPANYLGALQCIANNGSASSIHATLSIINAATNIVVATSQVWVPGHGQAILSYQPFNAAFLNHFCVASPPNNTTETNGLTYCVPDDYVATKVPSVLAPFRLQMWINNFTNNPPRTDGFGNIIDRGIAPPCD